MSQTLTDQPGATHSPTTTEEPCLLVNPAVSILRCSDNEVFIRHGSRSTTSHRIEDTKNRGRLADFAEAFAVPRTVSEAAQSTDTDPADAAEFTEHLLDGHALLRDVDSAYGYAIAGLGGAVVPTTAQLAVVGTGRVSTALVRQLSDLLHRPVEQVDDVVAAFEDCQLVVVAADALNPGLFYDADEAAMETGTPWQLVYVDGGEVMVGPTFIPGLTVGYYDLDTMDEAGRTMRMDYQFLKTATAAVPATAEVPCVIADLAAAYASLAVLQHLTGKGSYLENHVLRLDLERMHVIRDRVMRLARTPRDLANRNDLRHPFL